MSAGRSHEGHRRWELLAFMTTPEARAAAVQCPPWCTDHSVDIDPVAGKTTNFHASTATLLRFGTTELHVTLQRAVGYAGELDPACIRVHGSEFDIWEVTPSQARAVAGALIEAASQLDELPRDLPSRESADSHAPAT